MNSNLILSINSIIPWLQTSLGISTAVQYRSKFEGAFKIALLEKMNLFGVNAIPEKNRVDISWGQENNEVLVELKTINTNFKYPPCLNIIRPITKNINDFIDDIHKLQKKTCSEAYVCFIVFPCSDRDISWNYFLDKILVYSVDYQKTVFEFANRVPGMLYVVKIKNKDNSPSFISDENNTSPKLLAGFTSSYSPSNFSSMINIKSKRDRVPIKRGTYINVLKKIADRIKNEKLIITVSKLQEMFEVEVLAEIKKQNHSAQINEINKWIEIFRGGAKSAQIALNTINDKNRIHFRCPLKPKSEYNNFILIGTSDGLKYLQREITAFNPNVTEQREYNIFYSENKNDSLSIRVSEVYGK